jgi:ubiquinol cytochrome reductase-like transmembrane protein
MPHLAGASSSLLRACSRQRLPATSTIVAACQNRRVTDAPKSSFDSPFGRSNESSSTIKIPDFSKYASKSSPTTNKVFSYFVAGSLGLASAVGAKATVQGTTFGLLEHVGQTKSRGIVDYARFPGPQISILMRSRHRFPRQHVRLCRCPRSG